MKFLDHLEKIFSLLNRLGIFFGACTAGFTAAHEYVKERTAKAIVNETVKTEENGHT